MNFKYNPANDNDGVVSSRVYPLNSLIIDESLVSAINLYSIYSGLFSKDFNQRIPDVIDLSFDNVMVNLNENRSLRDSLDSTQEWEYQRGEEVCHFPILLKEDFYNDKVIVDYLKKGYDMTTLLGFLINRGIQDFVDFLRERKHFGSYDNFDYACARMINNGNANVTELVRDIRRLERNLGLAFITPKDITSIRVAEYPLDRLLN